MARILSGCGRRGIIPLPADHGQDFGSYVAAHLSNAHTDKTQAIHITLMALPRVLSELAEPHRGRAALSGAACSLAHRRDRLCPDHGDQAANPVFRAHRFARRARAPRPCTPTSSAGQSGKAAAISRPWKIRTGSPPTFRPSSAACGNGPVGRRLLAGLQDAPSLTTPAPVRGSSRCAASCRGRSVPDRPGRTARRCCTGQSRRVGALQPGIHGLPPAIVPQETGFMDRE